MNILMEVLKSIFLPCLIAGVGGFFLLLLKCKSERKYLFTIGGGIVFMFFWRAMRPNFPSARYAENLFVFFAFGSAYLLLHWDDSLPKKNTSSSIWYLTKAGIILAVVFSLCCKYFHYNPYHDYVEKVSGCIRKDSPVAGSAIVAIRSQYNYLQNVPQFTLPDFLKQDGNKRDFFLRAIRHYQFSFERLYITTDFPLEYCVVPEAEASRLTFLGSFTKNRKGKKIHVFRYDSPLLSEKLELRKAPPPVGKNLIRNGNFEQQCRSGKNSYYEHILLSAKNEAIPVGRYFPEAWDIYWGHGFLKGEQSVIYSQDRNPIEGNFSLFVHYNKNITFLHSNRFSAKRYLFQCDLRPHGCCTFGLQFSLRDVKNTFYGFREIKKIVLNQSDAIYHYEIELSSEMIYPFDSFYLYLALYGQGEIEIDNVSLTEQKEIGPIK